MGKIKRYACIIMLFGMSMQVLAQANDAHEGETGAATIVSLVASLVALIGTFVTYWKFKRQQFTDTITKERLNFIKDWRECATCFCGLLTLKNKYTEIGSFYEEEKGNLRFDSFDNYKKYQTNLALLF